MSPAPSPRALRSWAFSVPCCLKLRPRKSEGENGSTSPYPLPSSKGERVYFSSYCCALVRVLLLFPLFPHSSEQLNQSGNGLCSLHSSLLLLHRKKELRITSVFCVLSSLQCQGHPEWGSCCSLALSPLSICHALVNLEPNGFVTWLCLYRLRRSQQCKRIWAQLPFKLMERSCLERTCLRI